MLGWADACISSYTPYLLWDPPLCPSLGESPPIHWQPPHTRVLSPSVLGIVMRCPDSPPELRDLSSSCCGCLGNSPRLSVLSREFLCRVGGLVIFPFRYSPHPVTGQHRYKGMVPSPQLQSSLGDQIRSLLRLLAAQLLSLLRPTSSLPFPCVDPKSTP